ncbi:E1A-binding protein p400-like isoform X3 [Aquila chrysaetos chrysaetos]|uniref:E1A-binding protein p400-like isoform X3 n=1 Tax=Aquila chrysaetos chrysaetos TaxID=223781 RepID=UPI0011772205|nr:E1A-binding protein p400-like isoform X3 [Aquila chrysaetos chrysaetos]
MSPVPQVAQQISQEQNQQQNGPNLSSLHSSLPAPHSRSPAFLQQVQPAGCDKKHGILVPIPVPVQQQENEILQRITALRKEGLWSLKRLPKLQEAPRYKSHRDYLLEEMQWMATDFVQERRWKMITAKRLILSVARHHDDMILHKETCKKREEKQLRAVAAFTAREIEHFWSTIKQVVDLKLRVELEERRKKALNSQNISKQEIRDPLNKKGSLQKEVVLPDLLISTVKKYMADLADIGAAAEALLPKGSAQITTVVKSDTPSLLCGTLRDYQKTGLQWLAKLYKMNLNGILADEAGLGKTVQVVAFFAHLACNEGNWGPILVVSQNFNVLKWETELKCWCPALKILLYLGDPGELFKKRQEWTDPNNFNVCIASCKQFFNDYEAFMKVQWRYLVLDERQNGNNLTEKHWDAIFNLQSHLRLLLMDTLLPTALKDLWAIACFLLPGMSQSYLDFTKVASVEVNEDHYQRVAVRLQRVVQSFILRRSKIHVEKQLPRKYEHVLTCTLSNRQKSMYKDILSQPRTQECLRSGHFVSVLHILMQLLRVCNHPDLISPRLPSSSCILDTLEFTTASLVLNTLGWDLWKHADWSLFDVIGMENQITCYEAQILPKLKVTRKLIEEIYCSPSSPRLEPVKLKPNRLFAPVQYGQKPEGRTRDFSRSQLQQTVDTAMVMADHHGKIQGPQPLAMFSENQHRKVDDLSTKSELVSTLSCPTQGIIEEKRQLKEHLDKIYFGNERRCSRTPLYGRDLLEICSWISERKMSQHCSARINKWCWAGFANCLPYSSTSEVLKDPLQELILTLKRQQIALKDVVTRDLCVLPAVAVAPPDLYVANPPYTYTHEMKVLKLNLKEQILPYLHSVQHIARPHFLQFPNPRLVQHDSGKMEALAVLLRKLKARGHRVLILTQMIPMLDILELFLNFHFLTYIRVNESGAHGWHYLESIKNFNQDKRFFCAILSSHTPSTGVSHVNANTVVFYDTDLDPLMDTKAKEWCDKLARGRDTHIYRLVSGNSVEERLLKKGIKHLIQEVAAQGDDCSTDLLTQVLCSEYAKEDSRKFTEETLSDIRNDVDSELCDSRNTMVPSQLEQLASFVDQLKPIEKYALNFLELFHTLNDQKSQKVNKELKPANMKWEYRHPKELEKAEEKFQQEVELLTYTRQDAYNMEFVCEGPDGEIEIMPLWTPPVVPENHNDVYTDSVMCLMYTSTPIPESKLPPLFVRKARKRQRTDLSSSGESKKRCYRRMVAPPPSLFDQVTPRILNTRQKSKAQKTLLWVKQKTYFARPLSALINAAADTGQDSPAWLIAEDLALLKAVKQLRTLPLNLAMASPAQTANWDFVSDVVNSCSYVYRSPKQCQNHYIKSFVGPEGENIGGYPLRVRQAYAKDKNSERSQIYMNHFELMTMTTRKRSSSNRFLAENYDKLLPMSEVVSICAEPMTMQEKAFTEEQIAPQLQEQQPSQKQEEEQTMEQTQTQCQPQGETQALGRTLSAVIAVLRQVSVVPAIPAQLQPSTPSQFFQAEAFDSISCNHHSDGNCADGF